MGLFGFGGNRAEKPAAPAAADSVIKDSVGNTVAAAAGEMHQSTANSGQPLEMGASSATVMDTPDAHVEEPPAAPEALETKVDETAEKVEGGPESKPV